MSTRQRVVAAFAAFATLAAMFVAAPQASAAPATWFVDPGGDDLDACDTVAVPCATIAAAIAKAAPGDVVEVATGVYNGGFTIDKALTITSSALVLPEVVLPAGVVLGTGNVNIAASDVTIENVQFTKADTAADTAVFIVDRGGSWPTFTVVHSNITLDNVTVIGGRRACFCTVENFTVRNSVFDGQARDTLYFNAAQGVTTIENNTFDGPTSARQAILFEGFSSADPPTTGTVNVYGNTTLGKNGFFVFNNWVDGTNPSARVTLNVQRNVLRNLGSTAVTIYDPRIDIPAFDPANFFRVEAANFNHNIFADIRVDRWAIRAPDEVTVDGTNNWYGCNAGPGVAPCANNSGAGITDDPHLVLTLEVVPTPVEVLDVAAVTASLRMNSDGVDTSGVRTTAPDPIAFTATSGTIDSPVVTVAGQAESVFAAGPVEESVTVEAVLDEQTVEVTFDVVSPAAADEVPPVVTTPGNLVVPATSPAGATVTYTASAEDDVDGVVPVTCVPPSGAVFPIGVTTVTCTAVDDAGNEASAQFTVTVTVEAPSITDLEDLRVVADVSEDAVVTWTITATDAFGRPLEVTCTPPSGSVFELGETTVVCTAVDEWGGFVEATFVVTVWEEEVPVPPETPRTPETPQTPTPPPTQFTVTSTTPPPAEQLSHTGANTHTLLAMAAVLLVAGVTMTGVAGRRRRRS